MGKSGQALRELKKKRVTYTFTKEQLEQRDNRVLQEIKENLVKKIQVQEEIDRRRYEKEMHEAFEKEWAEREHKFYKDGKVEPFRLLQYMTAVAVDVLCEDFGWAPVRFVKKVNQRSRLVRFTNGVVDRFNRISEDPNNDIIKFSDSVYDKWGVKFTAINDED